MLKGSAITFLFLVGGAQLSKILFCDNLIVLCGSYYLKRQMQERKFYTVKRIPAYPACFLFPVYMEQSYENNGAFLHVIFPESLRLQFTMLLKALWPHQGLVRTLAAVNCSA